MNRSTPLTQRGVNVVLLLLGLVLLAALAIGAKQYARRAEADRKVLAHKNEALNKARLEKDAQARAEKERQIEANLRNQLRTDLKQHYGSLNAVKSSFDATLDYVIRSRIKPSPHALQVLKDAQRQTETLELHECMKSVQSRLARSMGDAIRVIEAALQAQRSTATEQAAAAELDRIAASVKDWERELAGCPTTANPP